MAKRRATKSLEGRRDLPRYFVWVRGLTGPEPQKWAALDFGIDDWKRTQILAYSELSEEDRHLSLATLASRFPPPAERN